MDRVAGLRILSLLQDIEAELDAQDYEEEFVDTPDAVATIREIVQGELDE